MGRDGRAPPIDEGAANADQSPAWSPDGQRIAFVRRIPERVFEVFVMPALGERNDG